MRIAFHVNPSQLHQKEHGKWLTAGFAALGLKLDITPDPRSIADIHIVSGPHYAKQYWIGHERTILLDRAYWHEEKSGQWASMDWVSLGWMRNDGGRDFKIGSGRESPIPAKKPKHGGSLFLADYDGPLESADTVRLHPARERYEESLHNALCRHRVAIGYQTTALVKAGLAGLNIICKDARNIMAEPNWLDLLPYADWHFSEIQSGKALEHLWSSLK